MYLISQHATRMATPNSSQVQVSHRTTTLGPPIVIHGGTKDRNILSKLEGEEETVAPPSSKRKLTSTICDECENYVLMACMEI